MQRNLILIHNKCIAAPGSQLGLSFQNSAKVSRTAPFYFLNGTEPEASLLGICSESELTRDLLFFAVEVIGGEYCM